jgi:hypothetical protein
MKVSTDLSGIVLPVLLWWEPGMWESTLSDQGDIVHFDSRHIVCNKAKKIKNSLPEIVGRKILTSFQQAQNDKSNCTKLYYLYNVWDLIAIHF